MIEYIAKYLLSGWEQLPFIGFGILANVISGIVAANDFSWRFMWMKLKDKLIFYSIALIAIRAICFFPVEGVPLHEAKIELTWLNLDLNPFKSLSLIATLLIVSFELLSTDENVFKKYERRIIPKFIGDVLRKFVFGQ